MNAVKHGLRARGFALLPEEDPAEWALHLADLRRDLARTTPTEEKLVTALAVAMWKEIRADHTEAGVLTSMSSDGARGRDLGERRNALSLGTAIRYTTAAGMATQRAQRAFLAHRKAKKAGLILPSPRQRAECTNELPATDARPEPASQNCTNEFPTVPPRPAIDPLAALRARIRRLLDGGDTLRPRPARPRRRHAGRPATRRPALPRPDRPRPARSRAGAAALRRHGTRPARDAGPAPSARSACRLAPPLPARSS